MKNYKYIFTHSSGNITLEHNPLNWATKNIEFVRSERYYSILRNSITEVELPFDGKAYIDTIYYAYGVDTDIALTIDVLDKSDFTYSEEYAGIVDLSEWVRRRDTTSVKIIDSSVMAKFVARDEIKVPISRLEDLDGGTMDVYTYLNRMKVTGVDIYEQIYMGYGSGVATESINTIDTIETLILEETDWDDGNRYYDNTTSVNKTVDYNGDVTIYYDIDFPAGGGSVLMTNYISENGTPRKLAETTISRINAGNESGSYNVSYSFSFVVVPGGNLGAMTLDTTWSASVTGEVSLNDLTTIISDAFLQLFVITPAAPDSNINMPLLHELGAKLLEIITGVSDPLDCELFGRTDSEPRTYGSDGDFSLVASSSGNMLRAFTNRPLTTSFADYFISVDALFNLGMWYNGTEFVITDKEDLYKPTKIITLGEVQGFEEFVSKEDYFNKVSCGYRDTLTYEEVNGNQNFNVPAEFANDGKRIPGVLDVQSIYHGDDYGIELARKKNFNTSFSEDTKYDDQIFFVWGKRDGANYETVPGSDFAAVTGIYAPDTRLNLNITPKRNLLRNLNRLPIPLFISGSDTRYLSKQYELDLATQISGDPVITEKDDLTSADYIEPLYYPGVYNFIAPLTNEHITQLRTDPHGYVEFDNLGVTYSGYILEVSTEPFMRKGNWTLLKRNPNR